jgi:hypothetical protein
VSEAVLAAQAQVRWTEDLRCKRDQGEYSVHIFIDESGGFQVPTRPNQVSCVSAVVVPETLLAPLYRAFDRTADPWRKGRAEIKGSQLNEAQMAKVIHTVKRFEVLLFTVAIDMGIHTDDAIDRHKNVQADKITAKMDPHIPTSWRDMFLGWSKGIRCLSNQLYVQSVLLTNLVHATLSGATLYYVQRMPKTLGSLAWRLDAKDIAVTTYEQLWQETVEPYLQWLSLAEPLSELEGADYSAFAKYQETLPRPPEHLRKHLRTDSETPFEALDTGKILSDLQFSPSHAVLGLQIVDMLGSCVRRACNGTLQHAGYRDLGRLMPRPQRGSHCVRFLSLNDTEQATVPYAGIIKSWDLNTRRMII